MHRSATVTIAALLTVSLVSVLPGCSGARQAVTHTDTHYVRASAVSLATIRRDTAFALTRHATTDTLILEEADSARDGYHGSRFVWLLEVPTDLPVGRALAFDAKSTETKAWLVEYRARADTHAVRVSGSVVVHSRTDTGVNATVVLRAIRRGPGVGEAGPETISVTRRALWAFDAPGAYVTPELNDNAG